MGYDLRDYQEEAIEVINNTPIGGRCLISLPTGSGKGVLISKIAAATHGRCLIVLPSKELREDLIVKLKNIDKNLDIGSVQASLDEVDSKIIICTRQSLTSKKNNRIERILENGEVELVFFDEVHQAINQVEKVIEKLDTSKLKIVGLTATPFNPAMTKVFNKINYSKDILWMIQNKYLIEPRAIQINTSTNISGVKTTAGEFNQKELEETINTDIRNDLIVKGYKQYAEDRKHTLVFCSGVNHCRDLSNEFNKQGIRCKYVDSTLDSDEREQVINEFKNGEIDVLCNVGVLTVGFDYQPTDCILLARPTKSKILFLQIIGRGLRLSAETGKKDCLILDYKDVVNKHNIMDMSSIFDMNIKSGETITEAIEREKHEEEEEKERQLQERLKREEEIRLQEEIIARELALFNSQIDLAIEENSYFDWFNINLHTYAISQESDLHYAITKINDNEFIAFEVSTDKNNNYCTELESFDNIVEAIKYVEENKIHNAKGGYPLKGVKWKKQLPTSNQLMYIKRNKYSIKSKWDAHKYFKIWIIQKLLNEAIAA